MIGATRPAGLKTRLYEHDSVLSSELRVALAPVLTYQRLLSAGNDPTTVGHYVRALRRPALVILVIAVMAPIMAVQRVTLELVATAAVSWSFVVVLQAFVAIALIANAPSRKLSVPQALDLWFAGHVPYSLWILVAFATMAIAPSGSLRILVITAIVPAIWTAFIVAAFCRTVLGATATAARWRVAAHFVSIWAITLSYIAWAAGGWFQLLP